MEQKMPAESAFPCMDDNFLSAKLGIDGIYAKQKYFEY